MKIQIFLLLGYTSQAKVPLISKAMFTQLGWNDLQNIVHRIFCRTL